MPRPVIVWNARPIVTAKLWFNSTSVLFPDEDPGILAVATGSDVEIQLKFKTKRPENRTARFQYRIQHTGFDRPEEEATAHKDDYTKDVVMGTDGDGWYSQYVTELIPINHKVTRFWVSVRMKFGGTLDTGSGGSEQSWSSWERRQYVTFVDYLGDFALDYLPVSLLYCPPSQDMLNGLRQSTNYETRVSLGFTQQAGTRSTQEVGVNGGVSIAAVDIESGAGGSANAGGGTGTEEIDDQSVSNALTNRITLGYRWETTLLADNQRVIGRRYWGPLGDIFVLLKNPWFSMHGTRDAGYEVKVSDRSATLTETLIVPVHKLLRPGDDPVASRIPSPSRRRILEMDPFVRNLDDFFPIDKEMPLEHAVDPYHDPSVGNAETESGSNRAARIGRYAVSTGVELNIEQAETIQVNDTRNNETTYYAEVAEIANSKAGFGLDFFPAAGQLNITESTRTGHYTKVSYQRSTEAEVGTVVTAFCKLCRNQNEADLTDLELWWDKHFSTFMFRRVPQSDKWSLIDTGLGTKVKVNLGVRIFGYIGAVSGLPARNVLVSLDTSTGQTIAQTMADHRGYYEFHGIEPGEYFVRSANVREPLKIRPADAVAGVAEKNLQKVRRRIDGRSSLWEIAEALQLPPDQMRAVRKGIVVSGFRKDVLEALIRNAKLPPRVLDGVEFNFEPLKPSKVRIPPRKTR